MTAPPLAASRSRRPSGGTKPQAENHAPTNLVSALDLDDAGDEHGPGTAADLPAGKGTVATSRAELAGVDRPLDVGIDDYHVGDRSRPQRAAVDAKHARRVDRHLLEHPRPG